MQKIINFLSINPLVKFVKGIEPKPKFNCPNTAFDKAIKNGRLSADVKALNFAGNYMYMDTYRGKDRFKNSLSREYDI